MVPMNPSFLEIYVKGKEKASFKYRDTITHRDGDGGTRTEHIDRWEYVSKKILQFKGNCFTFQGALAPGDYTIPFEFKLPNNVPASMLFENRQNHNEPVVKIKYTIQAILNMQDRSVLKYKQWLVLHEPPVPFEPNSSSQQTVPLTVFCCCGKGTSKLDVTFSKNVFYSNEIAYADVKVDNSQSQLRVKEIEF